MTVTTISLVWYPVRNSNLELSWISELRSKSIILPITFLSILIGTIYFVANANESQVLELEAVVEQKNEVVSPDREEKEKEKDIETVFLQAADFPEEQFSEGSGAFIFYPTGFPDYGTDIVSYYSEQLALANAGSGEAAYELFKLHIMCPYYELSINDPTAAEEEGRIFLKNLLHRGTISPEELEQFVFDLAGCIDMWSVAQQTVKSWYDVAKNSDFSLMKRELASRKEYERNFSKLTGESLVGGNIYAISEVVEFYNNVGYDDQLSRVWEYIGCKTHSRCDHDQYARYIRDQYYQYEADAIFTEAEKLTLLIESGEIRDFDFAYRLDPGVEQPVSTEDLFRKHGEALEKLGWKFPK